LLFLAILLSFPRVCRWSGDLRAVSRDGHPQ